MTVTLSASDPDSPPSAISYAVVQPPQHGTATVSGAQLTYMPVKGYTGPDSLTYIASDGQASSSAAAVSITVTQGNSGQPKSKGSGGYSFECLVNTGNVTGSPVRSRIVGGESAICYTVPAQGIGFNMIFKAHLQVFKKGSWVSIANKTWSGPSGDYIQIPAYLKASCTSGQTKLYRLIGRVTTPYDTGVVAGASTSLTCS